jgi:transcriptional regulator with XRE-family HTH domain
MQEVEWFGQRLKELREATGLSQFGLSEKAGFDKWTVPQLEQGRRKPAWGTVVALCKALGVTPDAFLQAPQGFGRASDPASKSKSGQRSRPAPRSK